MAININGTGSITGLSSISSPTISGGSVPLGDATAPGIVFSGDPNTGIYSPGADQVAISTNGTGRLFVNANGEIGANATPVTNYGAVLGPVSGQTISLLGLRSSSDTGTSRIDFGDPTSADVGRLIYSHALNDFILHVNGSERLRITSAGLVGIGTSSPNSLLSVNAGDIALQTVSLRSTELRLRRYDTGSVNGMAAIGLVGAGANGFLGEINFYTGNSDFYDTTLVSRMKIDSSGRVGIGTTSPAGRLHVSSSGAGTSAGSNIVISARSEASGRDAAIQFADGTTSAYVGMLSGAIYFADAGSTERARIDSSGRLLVGTSTSLSNFWTQLNYDGGSSNGLYIRSSATSGDGSFLVELRRQSAPNNTTSALYYVDSSAVRFELRNNGGLANYQANNVNLSDINTKKDISPAAGTWDCIKEWEIVNYRYKDQPDDADLNLGVIAQQVAESCPEVITVFEEAKDDQPEKLGIKEQQMYWMAIKALQEAQVRIEALEAEVAALKAQ